MACKNLAMTTSARSFTLDTAGQSIHVTAWVPPAPRATVQIVHGMAEHAGRYERLAQALAAEGWAVYAHDHLGHGRSVPAGETLGHMGEDGFARSVDIVEQLARRVATEHPGQPRVLFGHSMGSFMVQRLLYTRPDVADAIVMSASNGKPPPIAALGRYVARLERVRLGPRGKSTILDALSFREFNKRFAPNRTDFDWISSDESEVDAYCADPLCGFLTTVQTWIDLLDALPSLTAPEHLAKIPKDKPIYLFAGTQDPVGDMGKGVLRLADAYRRAGLRQVDVRLFGGGRHEMLHEKNADEVVRELVRWIDRALGAQASRAAAE